VAGVSSTGEDIAGALAWAVERLTPAGVADADREAAWLLAHQLGCSVGILRVRGRDPLSVADQAGFAALVERRAAREPIQYILGTEEFMGLTFWVGPAVLIPRVDTAVLVEQAVARLAGCRSLQGTDTGLAAMRGAVAERIPVRVADIGTGSGAIAVAVANLLPGATVAAVDLSAEALAVAAENARANGVAGRVTFLQGDLLTPLEEAPGGHQYDAILSNPPYIGEVEMAGLMPEVREWEPYLALTPGADGLLFYRRLAQEAPRYLAPGGWLGVEVGIGQAEAVARLFAEARYEGISVHKDTAGIDRAVFGSVAQ
jgi:release factor glutamine methyltransferase